jgi:Arc/MetJ-type ribon-helix-helix transcriptional regulator
MSDEYVEIELEMEPHERRLIDEAVAAGPWKDADEFIRNVIQRFLDQDERMLAVQAAREAAEHLRSRVHTSDHHDGGEQEASPQRPEQEA